MSSNGPSSLPPRPFLCTWRTAGSRARGTGVIATPAQTPAPPGSASFRRTAAAGGGGERHADKRAECLVAQRRCRRPRQLSTARRGARVFISPTSQDPPVLILVAITTLPTTHTYTCDAGHHYFKTSKRGVALVVFFYNNGTHCPHIIHFPHGSRPSIIIPLHFFSFFIRIIPSYRQINNTITVHNEPHFSLFTRRAPCSARSAPSTSGPP